jgi:uncharacterized membrane protein YqjE
MRALWSLPQAAPVLLRHLAAYVDLVGEDLGRARRDWEAWLSATGLAAAAAFFAVMMGCLAVVAGTWDTPHRLTAIAWMGGVFLACAVFALLYRSRVVRSQAPFMADVRREWREDRAILNRILSGDDDQHA